MTIYSKLMTVTLLAAALALGSCSDDDDWSAGKPANAENINVYMPDDGSAAVAMSPDENSFTVTVARTSGSGELTVPLKTLNANGYDADGNSLFSVPESVTFADGETEKEITVTCSESMEMFKTYRLTLSVPEDYTMPYSDSDSNLPRREINVVKEDYKPFAAGTYYSDFWGDDDGTPYQETATLEYSEIKDMYRFSNIVTGQTFTFSVDEDNKIEFGDSKYNTGYAHPSYGDIYISPSEDEEYPSYYDPQTKTFYFGWEYTVSAGSFGDYYEWFTVAE